MTRFMPLSIVALGLIAGLSAQARSLKGTYAVPTKDPSLVGASVHPVEFENSGDFMRDPTVRFSLPATLVGQPQMYEIVNTQRGEIDLWEGAGIEQMQCRRESREYRCDVAFTPGSIVLDEPAIAQALKGADPAITEDQVFQFLSVSREFADDPIGILRYDLRGGDRADDSEPIEMY